MLVGSKQLGYSLCNKRAFLKGQQTRPIIEYLLCGRPGAICKVKCNKKSEA